MLRTFEALFPVTLFKHFYIVSGPFIPSFSVLLNSVLLIYIYAFNRVLFSLDLTTLGFFPDETLSLQSSGLFKSKVFTAIFISYE